MAIESENKTEKPTERRRRLAREQGLSPRSSDLTFACRIVGVAAGLQWFGARLVRDLSQLLSDSLHHSPADQLTTDSVTSRLWDTALLVCVPMLGLVACALAAGLTAQWFQVGFRLQPSDVLPDFSRLSPWRSIGHVWRFENAQQAMFGLVKYVALMAVGGWCVWSSLGRLMLLAESDVAAIGEELGDSIVTLAWQLAGVALVFGVADYGIQFWKFEQSLKMSPEEVREEARQQGVDPRWRQQRGELWRRSSHTAAVESIETG